MKRQPLKEILDIDRLTFGQLYELPSVDRFVDKREPFSAEFEERVRGNFVLSYLNNPKQLVRDLVPVNLSLEDNERDNYRENFD